VAGLGFDHAEELRAARSYVLMCNFKLAVSDLGGRRQTTHQVATLGPDELSERIDALPRLRLEMPSLLGLRALDDLIPAELAARSSLDRRGARELAEVFVPTRAYHRALAVLREHRFAVLTGPPEMGKTAIARMIGLARAFLKSLADVVRSAGGHDLHGTADALVRALDAIASLEPALSSAAAVVARRLRSDAEPAEWRPAPPGHHARAERLESDEVRRVLADL
jgi:hypothetical protein